MPCNDPNCGRTDQHEHGDYPYDSVLVLADGITVDQLLLAGEEQARDEQLQAIARKARRQ